MTGSRIIAIDIGGTQLRLALFENNAILAREAVPTASAASASSSALTLDSSRA